MSALRIRRVLASDSLETSAERTSGLTCKDPSSSSPGTSSQWSTMRPPDHRYRRRYAAPSGSASVAAADGSVARVRHSNRKDAPAAGDAKPAHVHRRGTAYIELGAGTGRGAFVEAHLQPEAAQ